MLLSVIVTADSQRDHESAPATGPARVHYTRYSPASATGWFGSVPSSCVRDVMPSLVKTLRR